MNSSTPDLPWKRIRLVLKQIEKLNRAVERCGVPTDWQLRKLQQLDAEFRKLTGIFRA